MGNEETNQPDDMEIVLARTRFDSSASYSYADDASLSEGLRAVVEGHLCRSKIEADGPIHYLLEKRRISDISEQDLNLFFACPSDAQMFIVTWWLDKKNSKELPDFVLRLYKPELCEPVKVRILSLMIVNFVLQQNDASGIVTDWIAEQIGGISDKSLFEGDGGFFIGLRLSDIHKRITKILDLLK